MPVSLLIFLAALVVRAVHFWSMSDSVVFDVLICDALQYDRWARSISGGNWIGTEVFYQTPLYAYFLATIYFFFGPQVWFVRVAQMLISSTACVFLHHAGTRFFSRKVGLVAGLLLVLYPVGLFFDGILQKSSLDLFLMTGLLWGLSFTAWVLPRGDRSQAGAMAEQTQLKGRGASSLSPRPIPTDGASTSAFVVGVVLGALVLNRENTLLLVPVIGLHFLASFLSKGSQASWRRPILFLVGFALIVVPVGLRNQYIGGEFLLTTSQMGPNFYIGNNREATGLYEPLREFRGDPRFERDDARLLAEQAEQRSLTPGEVSRYWMGQAISEVRADPFGWLGLLGRKTFLTFHANEVVDAESERVHARDSIILRGLLSMLHFGMLFPLSILGMWVSRQQAARLWVLYGIALAFAVAVIAFYVMGRYRYPLVPVLMLFAAAGLVEASHRIRSKAKLADLALGCLLAIGAGIASNWPQSQLLTDQVTYINIANALQDRQRPQEAIAPLKEALRLDPQYADAYNNLGNVYISLGNPREAIASLEKAIALNPRMTFSYLNLAKVYEGQGETDRAINYSTRAIELDPLFAEAHQMLGRNLCSQGYFHRGMPHLKQAVKLDAKSPSMKGDLAIGFIRQGKYQEGVIILREAYRDNPHSIELGNNLAAFLATAPDAKARNGQEALAIAKEMVRLTEGKHPVPLDTLAAAFAEVGDFAQAVTTMRRALKAAESVGDEGSRKKMLQTLADYEAGRPYRDESFLVLPR